MRLFFPINFAFICVNFQWIYLHRTNLNNQRKTKQRKVFTVAMDVRVQWLVIAALVSATVASPRSGLLADVLTALPMWATSSKAVPGVDTAGDGVFHGVVSIDSDDEGAPAERKVDLTPTIIAVAPQGICGFEILSLHPEDSEASPSFAIRPSTQDPSVGELFLRRHLGCRHRRRWTLHVAALACDSGYGIKGVIHVDVKDENRYAPEFPENSVVVEIDEGKINERIIQLQAEDEDCASGFGDVCSYSIQPPTPPFTIDSTGVLSITTPLDLDTASPNVTFGVVAEDCGGRRGFPVTVVVRVSARSANFLGVDRAIHFLVGPRPRHIFGDEARLELGGRCKVEEVYGVVGLAGGAGTNCSPPSPLAAAARELACSARPLPWTGVFVGDAQRFSTPNDPIIVSAASLKTPVVAGKFEKTIVFFMRHKENELGVKEEILCLSDYVLSNRPHLSIFLTRGKMHLLLRHSPDQRHSHKMMPTEWRWRLPKLDDGRWHHYSFIISYPNVLLYLDGSTYWTSRPEIVDDWALHAAPVVDIRTVVGACWRGADGVMTRHFRGELAGMKVMNGNLLGGTLTCLYTCAEGVGFEWRDDDSKNRSAVYFNENSSLSIRSTTLEKFNSVLRKVAFFRTRGDSADPIRKLIVTATATCGDGEKVETPDVEIELKIIEERLTSDEPVEDDVSLHNLDYLPPYTIYRYVMMIVCCIFIVALIAAALMPYLRYCVGRLTDRPSGKALKQSTTSLSNARSLIHVVDAENLDREEKMELNLFVNPLKDAVIDLDEGRIVFHEDYNDDDDNEDDDDGFEEDDEIIDEISVGDDDEDDDNDVFLTDRSRSLTSDGADEADEASRGLEWDDEI